MKARIAYLNIFADDIERLCGFYAALFGFSEIVSHRSPIYRCLDGGGLELGFNALKAYGLLGVADRRPGQEASPVRVYLTIEVDASEDVDAAAARVTALGGRIAKAPYATYYNAWQCVLEDPERNIFRVNHRRGARTPFHLLPDAARGSVES